ncbi:MAG TPA: hypothetical protein VMR97_12600 [Acidimicrobiales bacterium]|nr:hypothetical protein [Acidimicrobiales bacterium]
MARRGTGRWVARAASTGGGRTYRGQAPVRWYASLVFICLVGVALVVYSRYERQHPAPGPQAIFSALAVDVCGSTQTDLPSSPATSTGIVTAGDGVIHTSKAAAGAHPTLGTFVKDYKGLELTSSELRLPGKSTLRSGEKCPSGSPDANERAEVRVVMWTSATGVGSTQPVPVSDPVGLALTDGQLITVAFVPPGASVPKPSPATIATMQGLISGVSTTTTTTPPTATTPTTPSSTTTSAPSSTTTSTPTSTTTSAPSSTTTSAP